MIQRIKDFFRGTSLLFGGIGRSREWPRIRNEWVKKHPACAVCGKKERIQCHHKKSFHLHPELELLESNFISLCEGSGNHHLWFGHLGNFRRENPEVEQDANIWLKKINSN